MPRITLLDEVEEATVTFISNGYTLEYSGDDPEAEEDSFSRKTRRYFFEDMDELLESLDKLMTESISEGNITIESPRNHPIIPRTLTEFNAVVVKFFDNGYVLEYSGRDEKLNWADTAHFCKYVYHPSIEENPLKIALTSIENMELTR